jgi:hypothetical protein
MFVYFNSKISALTVFFVVSIKTINYLNIFLVMVVYHDIVYDMLMHRCIVGRYRLHDRANEHIIMIIVASLLFY